MKNNEIIPIDEQKYYHLLDHEEMRIVDIDHLSKFVSTIYHHCIFPISKGKDFNKEWKSGKMYKLSKGGITIFCTAYTNGQMSFFITTPTKDEYDYFYVIEYQAEKDIEKNLDYYFEQISEWIIKSITSKKHLGQQSFEEKWITIFINRAEVFDKENIFGLENVGIERISRFIRAMQDISYIRLYVFPESIMEQGGAIIPKTSLKEDLENFDMDSLTANEKRQITYQSMNLNAYEPRQYSKAGQLQYLIHLSQGDYTTLSPKLSSIAKKWSKIYRDNKRKFDYDDINRAISDASLFMKVGEQISEGRTKGYHPPYELEKNFDDEIPQEELVRIGKLVSQGNTLGRVFGIKEKPWTAFKPQWHINFGHYDESGNKIIMYQEPHQMRIKGFYNKAFGKGGGIESTSNEFFGNAILKTIFGV